MFVLPAEIILWDTEYTAWEGSKARKWSAPGEHREIVQIGAIQYNTLKNEEQRHFDVLIKPLQNPKLSDFFVELTGLDQSLIDRKGTDFKSALNAFDVWTGNVPCYSYGRDFLVLRENCDLNGLPMLEKEFIDIRDYFRELGIDTTLYSSGTIVEAFGEKSIRYAHNAMNDARTIRDAIRLSLRNAGEIN